jgi:hypothetical protein
MQDLVTGRCRILHGALERAMNRQGAGHGAARSEQRNGDHDNYNQPPHIPARAYLLATISARRSLPALGGSLRSGGDGDDIAPRRSPDRSSPPARKSPTW